MKRVFILSFLLLSNLSFSQVMLLFEVETSNKNNMTTVAENWFGALKEVIGDDNGITMHHKGWSSKTVYFFSGMTV